jgi:tRNA threonylcarbamoyladenosine biosynthesis protein TsaE
MNGNSQSKLTIHSHSEEETRTFGARLGTRMRGGELIGLCGELGSGKTCLVRGLAEGLGVPTHKVRSPSFTLVNEYRGERLPLYHIDLYRLAVTDVDRMALREYLYGDGVCVVEWFDRLGEDSPHLEVDFTFVGADERTLVVTAHGQRYAELLGELGTE